MPLARRLIRSGPARWQHQGFTLTELLLMVSITAIVMAGSTITWMVVTRSSRQGGLDGQVDAVIQRDIAEISDLDIRFTCCNGNCTSTPPADSPNCASRRPGDERYYAPVQRDPMVESAAMASFREACSADGDGSIAAQFTAEINDRLPTGENSQLPTDAPTLSVVRGRATIVDPATHRIQIRYQGRETATDTLLVSRTLELIPHVAAWCP